MNGGARCDFGYQLPPPRLHTMKGDMDANQSQVTRPRRPWLQFAWVLGPGLMAMMADTDVGSIITAAQSGARWGYALLPLQILLIPVLYVVQELTVRLGIATGRGHGELICRHCGRKWGWVSVGGLTVAVVGAMITEFAGIAGVGQMLGMPRWVSLALAVVFLLTIAWAGSYRRVERVILGLSLFELVFLWSALGAHPGAGALQVTASAWHNTNFRYLVAANIGAVIMPWMVFFQQSAVVDKGLKTEHLRAARWDTAFGSVITQLIMAAVLVTAAETVGPHTGRELAGTIAGVAQALVPRLGAQWGPLIFALGITGAALVALLVTALAAAWGIGEMTGYRHSLEDRPRQAPWFYAVYAIAVIGAALVVDRVPDLVALNVAVEVMNALLLPLVLGFLVYLAARVLPHPHRLRGTRLYLATGTCAVTSLVAVWCGVTGMF